MNDTNELFEYPKGQCSFSPGGRLRQCTNVRLRIANGAKLKHSLAASPSGVVFGVRDLSGTLTVEIPKAGSERDYVDAVNKGTRKQMRVEIPGNGIVCEVVCTEADINVPLDDAVSVSVSFIGKLVAATSL
jgi:hypothetical protein